MNLSYQGISIQSRLESVVHMYIYMEYIGICILACVISKKCINIYKINIYIFIKIEEVIL